MYSKHEVHCQKIAGIQEGRFKNCCHLTYDRTDSNSGLLKCSEGCLEYLPKFTGLSSCPMDCHYFVDYPKQAEHRRRDEAWNTKVTMLTRAAELLGILIFGPFRWFAKLSSLTQALLIAVPLMYFSPRFAESLITIIKAFK